MKLPALFERFLAPPVAVFADFIDPFSYIGVYNLWRVLEGAAVRIDWRGFEFNPETPLEGYRLETGANSDLRPGMWASVKKYAAESGLRFAEPAWVPNTRRAHLLIESAESTDVKKPLIERIYQAYFTDGRDIGDFKVLQALAKEFGISALKAQDRLTQDAGVKILESRRAEAIRRGFPGLPGFVWGGKNYFGALSQTAWKQIIHGR